MANPAELHASSIDLPAPQICEAEILDNAVVVGDEVRCTLSAMGPDLTTDWCRFNPVSRPTGWFYPKKGDRALVVQHDDGPDAIVEWWPAPGADPDVDA